jgi:6-phosphogluconolactonase/glucosamine-6-phosphate isomerase/deaminase
VNLSKEKFLLLPASLKDARSVRFFAEGESKIAVMIKTVEPEKPLTE